MHREEKDYKYTSEYAKNICENIKYELGKLKYNYKNIAFNTQNEDILIRCIKLPNVKSKKDTRDMILYKVSKDIPININKYKIKYKTIDLDKDLLLAQVILVPKYLIDLCNEISNNLNMKAISLYLNFDILQKIIKYKLISIPDNTIIIENKVNEIIINKVIDNIVFESYMIQKSENFQMMIYNLIKDFDNIYYYGFRDFKEIEYYNLDFKYINLNYTLKVFKEDNLLDEERSEYINSLGVII